MFWQPSRMISETDTPFAYTAAPYALDSKGFMVSPPPAGRVGPNCFPSIIATRRRLDRRMGRSAPLN